MTLTVMVTAAGSTIGQGIIKSIKRSSLEYRLITCDANPQAAGLYRGDAGYLVPHGHSPDFVDAITEVCRKERVQVVCVGTDYELLPFALGRKDIEAETGAKIIVSSPEQVRIADDKWLTHRFLAAHGLPVIPSALPDDANQLADTAGFPLIVKPRIGDSSKDTWVVHDESDLARRLEQGRPDTKAGDSGEHQRGFVIQKYMGSARAEFTSSTICFDERPYGIVSMRREMRFGGHTSKAFLEKHAQVDAGVLNVAAAFKPFGPCNFQSRLVDGVPYVFEINCRFSGTTATCAMAGFNHVEASLRKVALGEPIRPLEFRPGMMVRYFNELFVPLDEVGVVSTHGVIHGSRSENNSFF